MISATEVSPKGLFYKENYLSQEEHDKLFKLLMNDDFKWDDQPQRREVKQYGQIYNYRRQKFEDKFDEIPDWLRVITKKIKLDGYFKEEPNQVIINKYRQTGHRNWSIPPHIDSAELFGDRIASITLGAGCVVEFCKGHHEDDASTIHTLKVASRSLYIMTKESRYNYYHRIPDSKYNKIIEPDSISNIRISLTFRTVL